MGIYESLNFAPVLMTDLFRLHNGTGQEPTPAGRIPYVAASRMNNGIVGYVDDAKCPGGWLSFVKDGDGGAGTCFYQPHPFWPSNHVYGLEPLFEEASLETLLFLASTITHQCFPKYNRGFAASISRMSQQRIMVPVKVDNFDCVVPDWEAMAELGGELREKTLGSIELVLNTNTLDDDELPILDFAPVPITDLFRLHGGAGRPTVANGKFPYVAASRINNGVVGTVNEAKCPGGWLSFVKDGDGGAGTCFYQPGPFWPSNHVFGLEPLFEDACAESLIFLAACITHQCFPKFNRGFAANERRMSRQLIMVPVVTTPSGETVPVWEGMTAYGRAMRVRVENAVRAGSSSFQKLASNA